MEKSVRDILIPYSGTLNYGAILTRVDIAYAVGQLSSFLTNPSPAHINAAKRVFRYLKGTINYGTAGIFTVRFSRTNPSRLRHDN
jgi:hypothetical protein